MIYTIKELLIESEIRKLTEEEISKTSLDDKSWDGWGYTKNKYKNETKRSFQDDPMDFINWLVANFQYPVEK